MEQVLEELTIFGKVMRFAKDTLDQFQVFNSHLGFVSIPLSLFLNYEIQKVFKNKKSWYTFFCAPNKMFAYMIVHLTPHTSHHFVHFK